MKPWNKANYLKPEEEMEETEEAPEEPSEEPSVYICSICGKQFTTERGLKVHERVHREEETTEEEETPEPEEEPSPEELGG